MSRWRSYLVLAAVALLVVVYVARAVGNICVPVAGGGCTPQVTGGEGLDIFGAFMGIIGGIVDALATVANHIVDLLPDMPDLNIPDLSGLVVGYNQVNTWLPLSEAIAGSVLVLAAVNAAFVFRVAVTVWHLIPKPFSGT